MNEKCGTKRKVGGGLNEEVGGFFCLEEGVLSWFYFSCFRLCLCLAFYRLSFSLVRFWSIEIGKLVVRSTMYAWVTVDRAGSLLYVTFTTILFFTPIYIELNSKGLIGCALIPLLFF